MGKPLLQLEPLRGVTDLMGFLGVIQDPKKYKAIVKELEDKRKELNTLIEVVGKVSQIEKIRAEAFQDRKRAAGQLSQTRAKIKTAESAWENTSTKERKELDDRSKSITDRDRKRTLELNTREQSLKSREVSAEAMMKDAIIVKDTAEAAAGIAAELRLDYEGKLQTIKDTLGKVTH